jgi:ABC-type multidrug transport system fused ATPase/permease subunit
MRPDADLYVFDEANSALDAAAQNELFEKITNGCITTTNGQTRKKTVIYVTHRLSTVRKADKSTCYLFLCELANLT